MKFYMPVKVYDEPECVKKHAAELASCGSRALIVTGRRSAKASGALDDVTDALSLHGKTWCVFPEVEENPSTETVAAAARFGLQEKADFVIGIGGGSPLDAAKAAAFLMTMEAPDPALLYNSELPSTHLPVAAVPTTCGTGSEVTGVSVLTMHFKKTKGSIPHRIYPEYALIDGKYLEKTPASIIVNTSVDALGHLVESYLSSSADDYSRYIALSGLRMWSTVRDILTRKCAPDADGRARLMRASTFAGMAIAQTGTSLPHALSYVVTYDLGLPHGQAVGLFLDGFLREAEPADQKAVLDAAGFGDAGEFSAFMKCVLPDVRVPAEILGRSLESVAAAPAKMTSCCFPADRALLERIVNSL